MKLGKAKNIVLGRFKPKYDKPKILLIDLPNETLKAVQEKGYNVKAGTFGSPYLVSKSNNYSKLITMADLPNYREQEIIFIDLTPPEKLSAPEGEEGTPKEEYDWWVKHNLGEVDPRPKVMLSVRDGFNRIIEHGGFFVIFAQPRIKQKTIWARSIDYGLDEESEIKADNWSFLSIFEPYNFEINYDSGKEMTVPEFDNVLLNLLRKNIKNSFYSTIFKPSPTSKSYSAPSILSKYNDWVGCIIDPPNSKGRILILPQIYNKTEIVVSLLNEIIPEISPRLFPHQEGMKWVEREEYELDSITKLKRKINEIEEDAKRKIEEKSDEISMERDRFGFLHGILTKTGDDLVLDVKSCLDLIGFNKVIDVDKEIIAENSSKQNQEDLQVLDKSPSLLLEVKGLAGKPTEKDTTQVVKYVHRRMKEWDRTDVQGVVIVNHERNVPPLDRDNVNVFTPQQIADAENQGFTLITTWDLFLLIRGMQKWGWDSEVIRRLFYIEGRMPRIPIHYQPIGKIEKYWEEPHVVGVNVSENILNKGDRVAYLLPNGYLEEDTVSIQVENKNVDKAVPGDLVGIKTEFPKELLRKGIEVFKLLDEY